MSMTTMRVSTENLNAPATKRQLFALFCLSKKMGKAKDYRNDGLTRKQASELISKLNAGETTEKKSPLEAKVERELKAIIDEKIPSLIATVREVLDIKSVVENDNSVMKEKKSFAMVGFGCGISIIDFDKRSKVGKLAVELGRKLKGSYAMPKVRAAFSASELAYLQRIGCPFEAIFWQDAYISRTFSGLVVTYMHQKGVRNIDVRTYDD